MHGKEVMEFCPHSFREQFGPNNVQQGRSPQKEGPKRQGMKLQWLSPGCNGDVRILEMTEHALRKAAEREWS